MRKPAALALIAILASPALSAIPRQAEPDRITVQHILIAFRGSLPGDNKVTRSMGEAEKLALQIFERAKGGEDFAAMVKTYTNDSFPGIYKMTNAGVTPDKSKREYPRSGLVKAFGDVGFSLAVGEIGLTAFDPATSKYGWHIIKRLE